VPSAVVRRARDYLARLDKFNAAGGAQPDLFAPIGVAQESGSATPETSSEAREIAIRLAALDPDAMTPRDALAALYELRQLLAR